MIWNHKDSDSIHVDPDHENSNKFIPAYLTNIISINHSSNIRTKENILSSPVYLVHTPSPVHSPRIFTNGTASDTQSPLYDSSGEIVTPKRNPTPHNNPPNPVPNVPDDPDSDPTLSDSSLLYLSDLSDYEYCKQRRRAKKEKETPE